MNDGEPIFANATRAAKWPPVCVVWVVQNLRLASESALNCWGGLFPVVGDRAKLIFALVVPVANAIVTESPGECGGAAVDLRGEIHFPRIDIDKVYTQASKFACGMSEQFFHSCDFIRDLITALALLPDQISAVSVKTFLLRGQPDQYLPRIHDIGHDAFHQRKHLSGCRKVQCELFLPRLSSWVGGSIGRVAHRGSRCVVGVASTPQLFHSRSANSE